LALDGVEEADEFLVPVALHAVADHRAVQYVEGGEQLSEVRVLGQAAEDMLNAALLRDIDEGLEDIEAGRVYDYGSAHHHRERPC
jgi:hypothetical protein